MKCLTCGGSGGTGALFHGETCGTCYGTGEIDDSPPDPKVEARWQRWAEERQKECNHEWVTFNLAGGASSECEYQKCMRCGEER